MQTFWDKLFDWLERVLPTAFASFVLGQRVGNRNKGELEAKLAKMEYLLEKKIAAEEARKKYEGKTDAEIVSDFLRDDKSGKSE